MNEYTTHIVKENLEEEGMFEIEFEIYYLFFFFYYVKNFIFFSSHWRYKVLIRVNYFYIKINENIELEYDPAKISIGEISLKDGFSKFSNFFQFRKKWQTTKVK